MSGRRGRPLETVAGGLHEVGLRTIYTWLLRTARIANPDPAIHTQVRFGRLLGRDGTFVSHVEAGRRAMPEEIADLWFRLVGIDRVGITEFLTALRPGRSTSSESALTTIPPVQCSLAALDAALDGAQLSMRDWASACHAARWLPLPRTLRKFCLAATAAMAASHGSEYRLMLNAMLALPSDIVVDAIRTSVEANPSRGYHVVDMLAHLDATHSGPVLLGFFREPPDPWMERSLAEAMRVLVERGEIGVFGPDPRRLQYILVDRLSASAHWASRIEMANLARALGPLPRQLSTTLGADADPDIRMIVSGQPADGTASAVRRLRTEGVLATLDRMYGSATTDPLADRLVTTMVAGRTRLARINAARAIALSPYGRRCARVLTSLTDSKVAEIRRAAAQALLRFPPSEEIATSLIRLAESDPDPNVRGRATWSLIHQRSFVTTGVLRRLLLDRDPVARRCAVDLAASARYVAGVRRAVADPDPLVARNASGLLATFRRAHSRGTAGSDP